MKNRLFSIVMLLILGMSVSFCQNNSGYQNINSEEFQKKMTDENIVILDVRTPGEYQEGHIENAQLMDYTRGEVEANAPKLDKGKTYLVYCRSGGRSANASAYLASQGFKVYNLSGGMNGWTGKVVK